MSNDGVYFCWFDGEMMQHDKTTGVYGCACGLRATEEFMEGLRLLTKNLKEQADDISRELSRTPSS